MVRKLHSLESYVQFWQMTDFYSDLEKMAWHFQSFLSTLVSRIRQIQVNRKTNQPSQKHRGLLSL